MLDFAREVDDASANDEALDLTPVRREARSVLGSRAALDVAAKRQRSARIKAAALVKLSRALSLVIEASCDCPGLDIDEETTFAELLDMVR